MRSKTVPGFRTKWMGWCAPGAALLIVLAVGLSCGEMPRQTAENGPRGLLLKSGELPLLMTRLGQYPRRIVTSAERVPVRFYFDPQIVDLTKVKAYALWSLEKATRTWRKIGTASPDALPLEIQPDEGLHGLRASVTCADGTEKLVPSPGDEPSLWLCVDRSPPELAWVSPRAGSSIRGFRTLDFRWTANEIQFGDAKSRLEWSADRGLTWKPIAQVSPAYGIQGYSWHLPAEVCSDVLVRVVAKDMAGHEASSILVLNYPGSVTSGGPALAVETPMRESIKAGEAQAGVAAVVPARAVLSAGEVDLAGAVDLAGRTGREEAAQPGRGLKSQLPGPSGTAAGSEISPAAGSEISPLAGSEISPPADPLQLTSVPTGKLRGGGSALVVWKLEGAAP